MGKTGLTNCFGGWVLKPISFRNWPLELSITLAAKCCIARSQVADIHEKRSIGNFGLITNNANFPIRVGDSAQNDLHCAQSIRHERWIAMASSDDDKVAGRLHGEQTEPDRTDNLLERLIYMILIAIMISVAQTVLGVMTVIQFVIMLVSNKQPNERLAEFGTDLGIWIAKAARYQTAASNVKPWPWTELD